jgi:hypothetical protein
MKNEILELYDEEYLNDLLESVTPSVWSFHD